MDYLQQAAQNRIIVLFIAAAVDLLIGDPYWLWHPVQGVGTLISLFEKILRRLFSVPPRREAPGNPEVKEEKGEEKEEKEKKEKEVLPASAEKRFHTRERIAGTLMVLLVLAVSTGLIILLLIMCGRIHPFLRLLFEGVLCGRLLALRSLGEAGYSVRDPLLRGDIEGARKAVSMIVGRDTERLDEEGIAKAAVETVAENTSDGVTAPLCYMILFGGIGGIFYKAVNTMDSMTGYKNVRYMFFGTAAARLDDIMNFIPARLTALFMILACYLPGKDSVTVEGKTVRIPDGAAAYRIWRRDRLKSPSPNSAQTESVCAGALHLRLLGDTWYFGEVHHKAEIGDGGRSVEPEDITRSVRLMNRTAFLMFAVGILILVLTGLMQG
jgi:adenosylcobinamide-phosphate synthase